MSVADISMSYDSVTDFADAVESAQLDFRDFLLALDALVESLDGIWEGKAKNEFDSAYKKVRKKLAVSNDKIEDFSGEVRKTVDRQRETDQGSASSFNGALPFGMVAGKPALQSSVTFKSKQSLYGNACPVKRSGLFSTMKADYEAKGSTYKWAQYGSSAVRFISGSVQVLGGIGAVVTGAGAPVGVVQIISGANEAGNAVVDAILVHDELFDQVGQHNMLKDKLTESGRDLGVYFGNEDMGEAIGKASYYGLDAVNFLDGGKEMLETFGHLNTVTTGTEKASFVWGDIHLDDLTDPQKANPLDLHAQIHKWLGVNPASKRTLTIDSVRNVSSTYSSGKGFADIFSDVSESFNQ